jgi:hypothetical protein
MALFEAIHRLLTQVPMRSWRMRCAFVGLAPANVVGGAHQAETTIPLSLKGYL